MPAPITRNVPQKNESPIPASGPMSAALTEVMEPASYSSGSDAFCSSIAQVRPMMNGEVDVAQLKNSRWRFTASFMPFGSSL